MADVSTQEQSFGPPPEELPKPPGPPISGEWVKNILREFQSPSKFEHKEISGGQWNREKRTYTFQNAEGITTEYHFGKYPGIEGDVVWSKSFKSVDMPDGTKKHIPMEFDAKNGAWVEKSPLKHMVGALTPPDTTGYVIQEKPAEPGVEPTFRLHLMKADRPIAPKWPTVKPIPGIV